MSLPEVAHTTEFRRVASLPRRVWAPGELEWLAREMTAILKTPGGTMSLFPIQALMLHDAGISGGVFAAPVGVGDGKTIPSMLFPLVWQSERSVLLVPGGLEEKTKRDRMALSEHWRIPTSLRIMSMNRLSLVQYKEELMQYQPDAIIIDEAHKVKNLRAACTRVLARYMLAHPMTKVAILTGSPGEELSKYAHLILWSLKTSAPVPITREEIDAWSEAMSNNEFASTAPGALLSFCTEEERRTLPARVAARLGFQRRLTETPGVVATRGDGNYVGASIYVRGIVHRVAKVTDENFRILRGEHDCQAAAMSSAQCRTHGAGGKCNPGWQTPDRWELDSGVDVWRHAQELAIGLHYAWDPRPPEPWRMARAAWGKFVRDTINRGRTYDSELHVANACDAGKLPAETLTAWREIRDTFVPNVVPVWHDTSALETCRDWMRHPGIVWTEHGFFAQRLAELTGHAYYGPGGFSAAGKYIEDASAKDAVIASLDANREGKNLQHLWHRNLMVCPPSSAEWWEQTMGRTHRTGQKAEEVTFDVLLGCRENFDACMKAITGAHVIHQMQGKRYKLLIADVTLPTEDEINRLESPRWQK